MWLKRTVPRLPEAAGPRHGRVAGTSPGLKLLVLGESPTAGVGVDHQDQAVGACLAACLAARFGCEVEWRSLAANGLTAHALTSRLDAELAAAPVDIALIALGVNDSLHWHRPRRWRQDLKQLISLIEARCQPRLIVLSPVVPMASFPALPFPIRQLLGWKSAQLDAALATLADTDPRLSRPEVAFDGSLDGLFAADGFHPNAAGHKLWAEQLAEGIARHWSS